MIVLVYFFAAYNESQMCATQAVHLITTSNSLGIKKLKMYISILTYHKGGYSTIALVSITSPSNSNYECATPHRSQKECT